MTAFRLPQPPRTPPQCSSSSCFSGMDMASSTLHGLFTWPEMHISLVPVLFGRPKLANHPAPPPRYIEPAPVAYDPYFDELRHLHAGCDRGSRRACIAFGEFIGVHKEREDMWRHTYPEFFQWDGY